MPDEKKTIALTEAFRNVDISTHPIVSVAIALALTVLLALLFPRGDSIELDYKVGAIWSQPDLLAPFSYPILRDNTEYAAEVEQAKKKVYPVFERDPAVGEQLVTKLRSSFLVLAEVAAHTGSSMPGGGDRPRKIGTDSARIVRLEGQLEIPLSSYDVEALGRLAATRPRQGGSNQLAEMEQVMAALMQSYLSVGILDKAKTTFVQPEVAVRKGTTEEVVPTARLYDLDNVDKLLERDLAYAFDPDTTSVRLAFNIGRAFLRPNLKFNKTATDQAMAAAAETVPRTLGFVQENERVIRKHERITVETMLKLESLARVKAERGQEYNAPLQFFGIMGHVAIVVALFGIYLFLFRKRIIGNNRRLALIALIILMEGCFAYLTRELNVRAPLEYLILVPAASMLLTIIFDSRVGFYGTVIIAFLVAGIRGNDYSVVLASFVAGALAVYTVRDMKNRTQIFRSLGFIFLGYVLAIVALALERYEAPGVVLEQITLALANAVMSPVLTYGLLIFFERVFKVTTDLTLIELSHFNHPLLRLLAEQAPGTYHHSLTMASLAEAAAAAVGGNEVLARVGAYFHDVGKIVKPTYFVENQKGNRSRHDKLSPRMSSLIIAAHVKDGSALAREYRLPEEVIEFIPMHHGTTRIEFFYDRALKLAQNAVDETKIDEIKDQDYRYPGPKPQTKETGILMLADTIEAAARTLEDPSPQKLEVVIDELVKKRFEEGELDECPLTLKDLTKIKAAFLGVLIGINHARVKYPEAEKGKLPEAGNRDGGRKTTTGPRLSRTIKEIERE
jgi:cyclic-di-AMP phosphodiesterase PgpH